VPPAVIVAAAVTSQESARGIIQSLALNGEVLVMLFDFAPTLE